MHIKRIGERDRDEELYTIDEELERLSRGLAWRATNCITTTGIPLQIQDTEAAEIQIQAQIICICVNRYIVSTCRKKTNIRQSPITCQKVKFVLETFQVTIQPIHSQKFPQTMAMGRPWSHCQYDLPKKLSSLLFCHLPTNFPNQNHTRYINFVFYSEPQRTVYRAIEF